MKTSAIPLIALMAAGSAGVFAAEPSARRALTLDDMTVLKDVGDPQLSPDGEWVAYTVRASTLKPDRRNTDIWMASFDGRVTRQITFGKESEDTPRWSPDGRYLAFLSSRGVKQEKDQVWVMERAGGEARQVTTMESDVEDFDWSPDGARMVLVVQDPDPDAKDDERDDEEKTPRPIVIDRYQFKEDVEGYLTARRRHLHLLDVASGKAAQLTSGPFDDWLPAWSPDGSRIVFVSKRGPDPDRTSNFDLHTIEPRIGASPVQLTTYEGADNDVYWEARPDWSPDGRAIAQLQGGPDRLIYYALRHLAVVPAAGGGARRMTPDLDRNADDPRWSADGRFLLFRLEDDQSVQLARVPAAGGPVERLTAKGREVTAYDVGPGGRVVMLVSDPRSPAEIHALEPGQAPRPISRHNDELMSKVRIAETETISFRSKDGTTINGLLVRPLEAGSGGRHPALLSIHGGPVSQHSHTFEFDWQLYAAQGYAVVSCNPRGSSGRGEEFQKAIWADWGHKDAQDVLAAVDHAVSIGVADPDRLGVGGWSYGGMLTNYTIAQDRRFKAAVSGAGISNILAGYGTDMYIREYEAELGVPWKNLDAWLKVSFPFLHADRITTPTLFQCGEDDFNVPLLNSEQMYQALRSLGVETQLVIYPGSYHGLRKPSYLRDRLERNLAWYGRFLKPQPTAPAARPGG